MQDEETSEPIAEAESENIDSPEPDSNDGNLELKIHSGEALKLAEISAITFRNRTQIIVIAGPVKSGKTTLITSLFHLFQRGAFANYLFSGSETLVGFDRRCHLARTSSGRETQDTPRTHPYIEDKFLHLKLRHVAEKFPDSDVLFLDISGENYDAAKNSITECKELNLPNKFDYFVLLIDGEKITRFDRRQRVNNDARMLLRSFLSSNILTKASYVDVLFTKLDLVEKNPDRNEHLEFIKKIKESISAQFDEHFGRLRFFEIAARPEAGVFDLGYGMENLLPSWVEESPNKLLSQKSKIVESKDACEFDRFFKRRFPHLFAEGDL